MIEPLKRVLPGGPSSQIIHECRTCGTSVERPSARCPTCGAHDIARYEI